MKLLVPVPSRLPAWLAVALAGQEATKLCQFAKEFVTKEDGITPITLDDITGSIFVIAVTGVALLRRDSRVLLRRDGRGLLLRTLDT